MKEVLTEVVFIIILMTASLIFGYHYRGMKDENKNLAGYYELSQKKESLTDALAKSDASLLQAQQAAQEIRQKEVVKYEKVYIDRIKNVATAQCVRDSGLLDVYDASVAGVPGAVK